MKTITRLSLVLIIFSLFLIPTIGYAGAFADEDPMPLPQGSKIEAVKHNQEGIKHWGIGQFELALEQFNIAAELDGASGEIHFNKAIAFDKLDQHQVATEFFGVALEKANGNPALVNSPILNGHLEAFAGKETSLSSDDGDCGDIGAPSSVSAIPTAACIPESAEDQARKFGFKCMTPETIEIMTTRAATNCRENIIKGHGKFRAGENQQRARNLADPATMMQEVMERTSFCVEKKSLLQCENRMNKGLHIDDAFCLPLAERFCGGTEEIRIKTDGTQIPYGTYVKWFPDLCSHYEIAPTQTAAIEKLKEAGGLGEKRKLGQAESNKTKRAEKRKLKKQRKLGKAKKQKRR
tara:strand:+ start:353 stop:1405 length:1053 start_codon:yes stop_codon:yes gene_type:complete